MAQKNLEKRNDILTVSYRLLSVRSEKDVSYSQIAEGVGISKSLLQYYFPKKQSVLESLVGDLLRVTCRYVSDLEPASAGGFQKIADLNRLFLETVSSCEALDNLLTGSIDEVGYADLLTDVTDTWLRAFCREKGITPLKARQAMCFSLSGMAELFHRKDEFGLVPDFICDTFIRTALNHLELDKNNVREIVETGYRHRALFCCEDVIAAYAEELPWFSKD